MGKPFQTMSPQQQAGILCSDAAFRLFLIERYGEYFTRDPHIAAVVVRALCGVASRKELATNHKSRMIWNLLITEFRGWQREPEVVG